MAINVTQKDETLHEIIAWAEQSRKIALHSANRSRLEHADVRVSWEEGRVSAFDDIVAHCKDMLVYSGSMPLEVENQSEDAK